MPSGAPTRWGLACAAAGVLVLAVGLGAAAGRPQLQGPFSGASGVQWGEVHAGSTRFSAMNEIPAEGGSHWEYGFMEAWDVPGVLLTPLDVASTADGGFVVADGRRNAVRIYDPAGNVVRWWDRRDSVALCDPLVPFAVTVDQDRREVHVGWHCYNDGRISRGFYLETRGLDEGEIQRFKLVPVFGTTDLDLHQPTGDLFVARTGGVHRIDLPRAELDGAFALSNTGARIRRLALTEGDTGPVAMVATAAGLEALSLATGESERLDVPDHQFLAVGAGSGDVWALAAETGAIRAEQSTADGVLVSIGVDGTVSRTLTAVDLGVTLPLTDAWPWAVDTVGNDVHFTAAEDQFGVWSWAQGRTVRLIAGGPAQSRYTPNVPAGEGGDGFMLAGRTDGLPSVLDADDEILVDFDSEGTVASLRTAPADSTDFAYGPGGSVVVATAGGRLRRLADGSDPGWDMACPCPLGGRVAIGGDRVFVTAPSGRRVLVYDVLSGARAPDLTRPGAVGLWPSDVAASADELFASDVATGEVHVGSAAGFVGSWPSALHWGARRLGVGPGPGGLPSVALITADGWIQIHRTGGRLIARLRPVYPSGAAVHAGDVALGAGGRLYVADPATRAVIVFEPRSVAEPPRATPPPSEPALCTLEAEAQQSPRRVGPGQPVTATLDLAVSCPGGSVSGVDIVLALDRSGSMSESRLAAAQHAARGFLERLDVRHHRVGVVAFSDDAEALVPLTDDVARALNAILGIDAGGGTNLTSALVRSRQLIDAGGRPQARPVILLMSDGNNSGGVGTPLDVAAELRADGVTVYTVGFGQTDSPGLRDLAFDADHAFYAPNASELAAVFETILRHIAARTPGQLQIVWDLPPDLELHERGLSPEPVIDGNRLRWAWPVLPDGGVRLALSGHFRVPGDFELTARATYLDLDERARASDLPPVRFEVRQATEEPPPSPTPRSRSVHLPLTLTRTCLAGRAYADLVLVMDASASMAESARDGDAGAAAARQAGLALTDALRLPMDRLGVVGFGDTVRVLSELTGERQRLRSAISGYAVSPEGRGSRLDLALAAVPDLLPDQPATPVVKGDPGSGAPPRKPQGVIVLSDGRFEAAVAAAGEAAAARLVELGVDVYAVGYGRQVDVIALRRLAPSGVFSEGTGEGLSDVHRHLIEARACPGGFR